MHIHNSSVPTDRIIWKLSCFVFLLQKVVVCVSCLLINKNTRLYKWLSVPKSSQSKKIQKRHQPIATRKRQCTEVKRDTDSPLLNVRGAQLEKMPVSYWLYFHHHPQWFPSHSSYWPFKNPFPLLAKFISCSHTLPKGTRTVIFAITTYELGSCTLSHSELFATLEHKVTSDYWSQDQTALILLKLLLDQEGQDQYWPSFPFIIAL